MKVCRNKNTIIKQGITKSNMNMTSTSEMLGFGFFPHRYTSDILSEDLVSHRFQEYSSKNEEAVLGYINKVKYRHGIGIPTTCGYHYCGKKGFNVIAMFDQTYFALPVNHSTLHHLFAWTFYHLSL